jgi:hypothetical protein
MGRRGAGALVGAGVAEVSRAWVNQGRRSGDGRRPCAR